MNESREPKLLDLVAVVNNAGGSEVAVGDMGTVVELLQPDGLDVEFLDREGRMRCVTMLKAKDILVLDRERMKMA
jgi:hypothetical protein